MRALHDLLEGRQCQVGAHQALGCTGMSRTDFRWDDARGLAGLYLLETNTQPGMPKYKDVNGDGEVNIEDATLVQKYVVHIENLTGAQKMLTNEKNYENITVTTATNLQKHIVGLEPEFKNNDIFIDEQRCVSSLDDTLRWYNYCNFNICPRRNDVTSGTYIDNNFICMDKIFGYRIWCDKNGYDYL